MPRYVAFLRGVSPLNARMHELKRAFEVAGFGRVRTVLSSGNVVFDAPSTDDRILERLAEEAMSKTVQRSFYTIVRDAAYLGRVLEAEPYSSHGVPAHARRVISFLREAREPLVALPLTQDQATVLCRRGREVYTAYVPTDKGPVFMRLIERAFGRDVTTRTIETVARCAAA